MKKVVLVTSLYRLRKHNACSGRYDHLVGKLGPEWGDKDDINLLDILKHNGTADCIWALCATVKHPEGDRAMRLMAADFAEAVLPIFEREYPDDDRPRKAIQAARYFANGKITDQERDAARAAAWAAGWAAAWDTARAAAWGRRGRRMGRRTGRRMGRRGRRMGHRRGCRTGRRRGCRMGRRTGRRRGCRTGRTSEDHP